MTDFFPPAFTERIGDEPFARIVFRDSIGRFFDGKGGWTASLREAAVYCRECDAIAAQIHYFNGEPVRDAYVATIVVTTGKDAFSLEDLMRRLARKRRFLSLGKHEAQGILVELIWEDLRKVE
jgi:hypothetical protein